MRPNHLLLDRRHFLAHAGSGLGSIALAALLAQEGLLAADAERLSPYRIAIDAAATVLAPSKQVRAVLRSDASLRAIS